MTDSIPLTNPAGRRFVRKLFPEYRGRKMKVVFTDSVTLSELIWGGGTRNFYKAIHADGSISGIPILWPELPLEGQTIPLPPTVLLFERSFFCGHDMGITIYAHTSLAPKMLMPGL